MGRPMNGPAMKPYAAVFLSLCPAFAAAQEAQVSGHAGWEGHYQPGDWTPVVVDLDNPGKAQDVHILVCWGSPGTIQPSAKPAYRTLKGRCGPTHRIPVAMPANSRKSFSVTLLAPGQENLSVWAFAATPKGKHLSVRELPARPLEPRKRLLAVAGTDRPHGLDLSGIERAWVQPDRLPEDWRGYASLDALLWLDADAAGFRSQAQIDALKAWVSSGGHLLVARANTAGLSGTFLADLLPVTLGGIIEVEHLDALGPPGARGPEGRAVILQTAVRPRGRPLVLQDSTPLIVEATQDAGKVTFLAFDPAKPPFSRWTTGPEVWNWILGPAPEAPPESRDGSRVPRLIGSDALTRASVHFHGVLAPAIGRLFGVIVLFLAVTGPADYLVLRCLRRLEATWITFPACVLAFTAFILVSGAGFMRNAICQREIAVVDHYLDTGFTRRRAIEALLAPKDISLSTPDAEPISSNFLVQGVLAGDSGEPTGATIHHDPAIHVRDWSLRRGATGLALADSCSKEPSPLTFTVEEAGEQGVLVAFRNRMEADLTGAVLLTPAGVYDLGEIPRGVNTLRGRLCHPTPQDYPRAQMYGRFSLPDRAVSPDSHKIAPPISVAEYMNANTRGAFHALPESTMDAIIARLLAALSFRKASGNEPQNRLTGFARGLDATPWISEEKGLVLLAWARGLERPVAFDPVPGQRNSVVLLRFFQRRRE